MKSKIHRATVTQADLHYVGSVTISADLMEAADLLPGEQVDIVDIDNGARLTTYVIEGPRDSGTIGINGAAAPPDLAGDLVIVIAYGVMDDAEARTRRPRVVFVDERTRSPTAGATRARPRGLGPAARRRAGRRLTAGSPTPTNGAAPLLPAVPVPDGATRLPRFRRPVKDDGDGDDLRASGARQAVPERRRTAAPPRARPRPGEHRAPGCAAELAASLLLVRAPCCRAGRSTRSSEVHRSPLDGRPHRVRDSRSALRRGPGPRRRSPGSAPPGRTATCGCSNAKRPPSASPTADHRGQQGRAASRRRRGPGRRGRSSRTSSGGRGVRRGRVRPDPGDVELSRRRPRQHRPSGLRVGGGGEVLPSRPARSGCPRCRGRASGRTAPPCTRLQVEVVAGGPRVGGRRRGRRARCRRTLRQSRRSMAAGRGPVSRSARRPSGRPPRAGPATGGGVPRCGCGCAARGRVAAAHRRPVLRISAAAASHTDSVSVSPARGPGRPRGAACRRRPRPRRPAGAAAA